MLVPRMDEASMKKLCECYWQLIVLIILVLFFIMVNV
jgi:hypothetical protein